MPVESQAVDPVIHQAARRLAWRNVGTIENLLSPVGWAPPTIINRG